MSPTLIICFFGLFALGYLGRFFIALPKNIWLLFVAQPLAMASSSMVVFAGGLLATQLAPDPEWATLPLTLMILGTATAVLPASLLMKKMGRRNGMLVGLSFAFFGAILASLAAMYASFLLLICGAILLGTSLAFVAQMRFAAIESLKQVSDAPKAVSVLMVGGMFAAVIGPEVAVAGKQWLQSPYGFAGSFLALALLIVLSMLVVARLDPILVSDTSETKSSRSLITVIRQPLFIIALLAGVIGYSVMSYVMTATPMSMHDIHGHSLESTKWVIQSHIIAMYLPSLFSALLVRYIGVSGLMLIGCFVYATVILVALSGQQVGHYWWALVLLGIGWNFLYTSGTILLPQTYQGAERFKAQAVNDFSIFFVQAMASLSAGIILFSQGWHQLIMLAIPMILIIFAISLWHFLVQKNKPLNKLKQTI